MSLDVYREIVPDWAAFRAAASRPQPETFRTRVGRIDPAELAERLARAGFRLSPVDVPAGFFRVDEAPVPVSRTPEHWLGLLYVQQRVTGLAAPALGVRPGDGVLDLCAAPGGKTTHLAELVGDRTRLVAADPNEKRLRALVGNLYRLGQAGVMVVEADGRELPGRAGFDRVLVDAPCSAEGNVRRFGGALPDRPADFLGHATRLQSRLLRRAIALTRPGGTVLYVTCTFRPEENEGVVDEALNELPVSLEAIPLDAPHAPGLTRFQGQTFHPDLSEAWRVYPHHLDSGGLFMARLRVEEPTASAGAAGAAPEGRGPEGWEPVPPAFPGDEMHPEAAAARLAAARDLLREEFGVSAETLGACGWIVRGDSVWAHRLEAWPWESWSRSGAVRFVSMGIRVLTRDRRFGERPTNDGLRWLGPYLRDRVVDVDRSTMRRLLAGEAVPLPRIRASDAGPAAAQANGSVPGGPVALRLEGYVAGRGIARRGALSSEIPKTRARRLARLLAS